MSPALPSPARPRPAETRSRRPLVVGSIPSGHVYVRHLAPETGQGPVRLPDPAPRGAAAESQRWWPPVMLDPAWVRDSDVDLVHLHFGFDAQEPDELAAWVAALRRAATPLVFTVHDLRNPHHATRAAHDAQLDVLVPAADALITLTPGAADEIERRWGRRPQVVPHPHVVPLDTMQRSRSLRSAGTGGARAPGPAPFRVGLHVKSLRASMAPHVVLPDLVDAVAGLPGAVLQVNAHRDVLELGGARYDAALARELRRHADAGRVDLRVHDYLSDDALWTYLSRLDVSVLPYRFGTHSGWLEACRDLRTTVVAPTCGYFAEQGPVLTYRHDEDGYDPGSLVAAVREAHERRPDLGATVAERRDQRRAIAAAHDEVYAAVTARSRAGR